MTYFEGEAYLDFPKRPPTASSGPVAWASLLGRNEGNLSESDSRVWANERAIWGQSGPPSTLRNDGREKKEGDRSLASSLPWAEILFRSPSGREGRDKVNLEDSPQEGSEEFEEGQPPPEIAPLAQQDARSRASAAPSQSPAVGAMEGSGADEPSSLTESLPQSEESFHDLEGPSREAESEGPDNFLVQQGAQGKGLVEKTEEEGAFFALDPFLTEQAGAVAFFDPEEEVAPVVEESFDQGVSSFDVSSDTMVTGNLVSVGTEETSEETEGPVQPVPDESRQTVDRELDEFLRRSLPKDGRPGPKWFVLGGAAFVAASLAVGGYLYHQGRVLPRKWQDTVREAIVGRDQPVAADFFSRLEEHGKVDRDLRRDYGRFLFAEGNDEAALEVLLPLDEVASLDGELLVMIGQAQNRRGDLVEASRSYQRALDADSSLWEAHLALGLIARDEGRLEDAEASFRRALEIVPQKGLIKGLLGEALADLGRWEESLSFLEEAVSGDIEGEAFAPSLERVRLTQEEREQAERLREEERRMESQQFNLRSRGWQALISGSPQAALAFFEEAAALSGEVDLSSLEGKARALVALDRYEEAVGLLERLAYASEGDPDLQRQLEEVVSLRDEARRQSRLAELHKTLTDAQSRGDEDTIVALASTLRELDPSDGRGPLLLGRIALAHGNLDRAEVLFREARRLEGADEEAQAGLRRIEDQRAVLRLARAKRMAAQGILLSESGEEMDRAQDLLEGALRLEPDLKEVLFPLARTLAFKGESEKALHYYRRHVDRFPQDGRGWNNLGLLHYRLGHPDEAERNLVEGLAREPMSRKLARNLAILSLRERQEEETLDRFRYYLALDPASVEGESFLQDSLDLDLPFPIRGPASDSLPSFLPVSEEEHFRFWEPFGERSDWDSLQRAFDGAPDESEAYYGFLLSLGQRYSFAERRDLWNSGLALVGAHSFLAQGRFLDASGLISRLPVRGDDNEKALSMLLGHALFHLRQFSEARESYRQAYLLAPGDPVVRDSLRRLLEAYASRNSHNS